MKTPPSQSLDEIQNLIEIARIPFSDPCQPSSSDFQEEEFMDSEPVQDSRGQAVARGAFMLDNSVW
jgi:hypothetical protein